MDDSIGYLTGRIKRELSRLLNRRLQEAGSEITGEQFRLLLLLWRQDYCNQQDIADAIGKDKTSIARMLHTMEKQGWIERKPDETDRRNNRLMLTEQGMDVRERHLPVLQAVLQEAENAVSDNEMAACKEVLRKIIQHLAPICDAACKQNYGGSGAQTKL